MSPDQNDKNDEWLHLLRIGLMIFVTFVCCILFFFILFKFQGFASIWGKLMTALTPIIIGLVLAYLMNPIMKFSGARTLTKVSLRYNSAMRTIIRTRRLLLT